MKRLTYIIEQRERRPGRYANSPNVEVWRQLGPVNAPSMEKAREWAMNATGAALEDIRVGGVQSQVKP